MDGETRSRTEKNNLQREDRGRQANQVLPIGRRPRNPHQPPSFLVAPLPYQYYYYYHQMCKEGREGREGGKEERKDLYL